VTRVLSGAVLLVFAVAIVWFAPRLLFFAVAELLLVLGCWEFAGLARASGLRVAVVESSLAAALCCASVAGVIRLSGQLDVVLLAALVVIGVGALVTWNGGRDAVAAVSASMFPSIYLGLPIGAMVVVREGWGARGLFLLMLTVVVSDSAQYYSGRTFGRTPLAPSVSPKKTIEGAVGGFIFGAACLAVVGAWWLPGVAPVARALLGIVIVTMGIVGDLFESMLKRSAGVKDSSALIPGHGGILDRIDALLFAAPVYYIALKYL